MTTIARKGEGKDAEKCPPHLPAFSLVPPKLYSDFLFYFTFLCATGHYQPIGVIPEGARNVQIRELSGFRNYLGEFTFLVN